MWKCIHSSFIPAQAYCYHHSLNCVVTMWTTKLFSPLWLLNVNLQTHPTWENFCTMFASVCNISIAVTFKLSCPSPHPRWLSCQPTCASPENLSLKTFKFIKSKNFGGWQVFRWHVFKNMGWQMLQKQGWQMYQKGGWQMFRWHVNHNPMQFSFLMEYLSESNLTLSLFSKKKWWIEFPLQMFMFFQEMLQK